MADPEHLSILKQGADVWNKWRTEFLHIEPELSWADLRRLDFTLFNFRSSNLAGANLIGTSFYDANLEGSDCRQAKLLNADLRWAQLAGAKLSEAYLVDADLSFASLVGADLRSVDLRSAHLVRPILEGAQLDGAKFGATNIASCNLSVAIGLETVNHYGPSFISLDTLIESGGRIPAQFLRGCGIPEEWIQQLPSLIAALEAIQFHSCFISYSHQDEQFAKRLHSRMRSEGLRVWFAPEEMKGGEKLHDQIFSAIQVHDKLLLILSEESMASEWVATEIRRARREEREQNRRKLFPIRLVDFERIQQWECFDADSGTDLAVELREYFIPDFSNWKDHDAFEAAFAGLLKDLKTEVEESIHNSHID